MGGHFYDLVGGESKRGERERSQRWMWREEITTSSGKKKNRKGQLVFLFFSPHNYLPTADVIRDIVLLIHKYVICPARSTTNFVFALTHIMNASNNSIRGWWSVAACMQHIPHTVKSNINRIIRDRHLFICR
jgi:hypothetical protein